MTDKQTVALTPGYMLHARPFRDSSAIADFFTRDYGRISLVARGARRPKSRLKGQLRPFQRCLVSWVTRGSLGTLTALEMDARAITGLPRHILSAYYANELIIRAMKPGDSQADVFDRYEQLLVELGADDEARVLRLFERDLLDYLGYGLQLAHTQAGKEVRPESHYHFDVTEGPLPVPPRADTVAGSSLLALASGSLETSDSLRDAKRLLRLALEHHLGAADSKVRQVLVSMQSHRKEWARTHDKSESNT